MDTLSMIILVTLVVIIGVAAGAIVQRKTYFLYPVDAFTLLLVAFIGVEVLAYYVPALEAISIGIEPYWYAPLLIGYVVGYTVKGMTRYIMVRSFNPDKSTVGMHWIIYTHDGRTFRQAQTNRELFKRLIFGIEHEIVSNADLEPDWDDVTRYPLFPEFRRKFLMVEWWETVEIPPERKVKYDRKLGREVQVEPRVYLKRYVTTVRVARGSMVSRLDLVKDARALDRMQADLIEANNQIFRLQQSLNLKMADTVAEFLASVYSTAPGASLSVSARRWKEKRDRTEKERERNAKQQSKERPEAEGKAAPHV